MKKKIKNLYLIFVLIFSGMSTSFYRSQNGIIVLFLITLMMMFFFNVNISKRYIYALGIWLIYSVIITLKNGQFHEFFIFRHIVYITVAYTIFIFFKESFFIKFENYIYYLALFSLPFVFWEWINPSSLNAFASLIDISGWSHKNNFIIYTQELRYDYFFPRNCGFTWEPGPFAVFLTIAILFNLFRNSFKITGNRRLIILLITLITTQSTTGLSALGALAIYIIIRELKGIKKAIFGIISILIFTYLFFTLDFMYEKIDRQIEQAKQIEARLEQAVSVGTTYSTGRIGGFVIGWKDLKQNPILGIGGNTEERIATIEGVGLSIRNGLANIMSTYGLFGIIIFVFVLKDTSKFLSQYYGSNAHYAFFLIILAGNIGFYLLDKPILFSLIFYSIFEKRFPLNPEFKK